jgi:hypothetical protein
MILQERNAATLLFSALMGRVFGVKHTPGHEELPRKNRMTGRIFFRLYPSLFELLASELKKAAEMISCRNVEAQLTPSLHPVLLILARLYPSSLEGTDTSLNVSYTVLYFTVLSELHQMSLTENRIFDSYLQLRFQIHYSLQCCTLFYH